MVMAYSLTNKIEDQSTIMILEKKENFRGTAVWHCGDMSQSNAKSIMRKRMRIHRNQDNILCQKLD